MKSARRTAGWMALPAVLLSAGTGLCAERERAREVLDEAGVQGGLVLHLGCGDGRLTSELGRSGRHVVRGLERDDRAIAGARRHIAAGGLYGRTSVGRWDGVSIPCVDNLANLIVCEEPPGLVDRELMRALAPGGVLLVRKGGRWTRRVKPWPEGIDEWTHYLHGPDNNAVARDNMIAPPRSMQWKAGPMWCRSHEYNSSMAAMVSANGRLFYVMDQGLRGIIQIYEKNQRFPPRWALVARDAFNGVKLWERRMQDWSPGAWDNYGFRSTPLVLPRRLVAIKDRVYVTLSYRGPMTVLDAATGSRLRVCERTANAHEIVAADGIVVLRVRDEARGRKWVDVPEYVMAVDADSGATLWKRKTANSLVPLCLAVANGRVCYHNYREVVCLDLRTGAERWRAASRERSAPRSPGGNRFRKGNTGILVVYRDVVLFTAKNGLESFSLDSGRKLWTGPVVNSVAPPNCFVATGLFCAQGAVWPMAVPGALHRRGSSVSFSGLDPKTGEVTKRVKVRSLISRGHHVRCYPGKATERYLLLPKRGVEFVDLTGDDHMRHDWLRGVCAYGVMPANGLLYLPPHQCFCYPGVTLKGFNALSAASRAAPAADGNRLVRGPAYSEIPELKRRRTRPESDDWPAYRHDRLRSGCTKADTPTDVREIWRARIGGRLAQPVLAAGRLYAVRKDAHTVHCIDAKGGDEIWTYTGGARIDSPPTVFRGLLLFGCRDGWVYCLSASQGRLVWRFRAAPTERQITAFGQLESTWPVHGSVLVQDDIAYFAAGRSSYLDGGIRMYGLDAATGKLLHRGVVASDRPDVTRDPGRPFDMEGALSDILVSDGTDLYMYQVRLNPDLTRQEAPRSTSLGARPMGLHLMSTKGFVDDTWYDRMYWSYSRIWPGFYFSNLGPKSGQILVFDEDTTCGLKVFLKHDGPWWGGGHSPYFIPEQMDYQLFADDNANEPVLRQPDREKGSGYSRKNPAKWTRSIPVRVKGMVLAGGKLYVAGPPNKVLDGDPFAAFEGRMGSEFRVYSSSDGEKLAQTRLRCVPVFDGLIAAGGRLYMATTEGQIICLGE